ncbi:hypothetical protein FK529_14205 [Tsukamurella asaccharolytica]|uniref:Uncharacterized protein n=1 Tax=Tsukamurella asaccharolytica TaxID=2592067 RepID=A0A5C5R6Z7_9ACTN|nr:hypothetical protein [Tsukamurella asaccharolytica]TWS18730.1 hypothetical protein FK529_14205 [Tsukamurella asaccharolytica]
MRALHRLTATVDTERSLPTEDGVRVSGVVEVVTECDRSGRASMRCRAVGDDTWHPVTGGSVTLPDPADLPFHHSVTLSRLLSEQLPPPESPTFPRAAFYFCDDLDAPPSHAA